MIGRHDDNSATLGLTPVWTAVVWIGCVAVGVTGILVPANPGVRLVKKLVPLQAKLIHVDMAAKPWPAATPAHAAAAPAPTPPPVAPAPPPPPAIAAVAAPSATIAFALPTTGPTRIVSADQAVPTGSASNIERITYGVGEGQQPKPEYPLEAALAREGGTVRVRYTIGEDGSVVAAEAIKPCPYPVINESAVRTVREEWRFPPGQIRIAETDFEFNFK